MRLREFLEQHLPPFMLIDQLHKQYNIKITPLPNNEISSWSIHSFDISRAGLKKELEQQKISVPEFENIIKRYGWYISYIREDRLNLTVENNFDNDYYSTTKNAIFKNKYLHITNVQPSRINDKGLIAKDSTDHNVQKNLTMQRDILYPNRRVYLWDLEEASGSVTPYTSQSMKKVMRAFSSIIEGLHAKSYGSYAYLITLPDSIRLHYDNEYGVDNPARYITQNIPPSYIRYIGTVDRLCDIIENNDYRRLEQVLSI